MRIGSSGGSGDLRTCGGKRLAGLRPEETVKRAMGGGFAEKLQKLARQDAKKGIYMDRAVNQLRRERMREAVSPDRSKPIGQVNALLQAAAREGEPLLELLDQLLGNCSGRIRSDPLGQTAEIRAPNGEVIASYNSLGSGWTVIQTKAEQKFFSETAAVYAEAYKKARAEMKAAEQRAAPPPEETALDTRV